MHFSIPDTQECTDHNGSNYTGYNIHLNGEYHCTVRYKQLFNLHEQLKKFSGSEYNLPSFPPKKYWPLTPNQVEDRRAHLEKYIQAVGQSTSPINLDLFYAFLLTAQQESTGERIKDIILDVYLMNGYKISVSASSNERSYSILEKACNQINLPNVYVYYFSLYLILREENGDLTIVRKLQDFEAPYISQKNIEGNLKIMLRKSYWEPDYDLELMHDRVALNLLYVQTISDLERGWILCGKNTREQLAILQARGAKKELKHFYESLLPSYCDPTSHPLNDWQVLYPLHTASLFMVSSKQQRLDFAQVYLDIARNLRYYGYMQFKECICDYPTPDSKVLVSAGQKELNLRIEVPGGEIKERSFKVTRMRCWRITTHNDIIETEEQTVYQKDPQLDLSFEYLMSKDNLQWITITSEQAILMAVCLQSIVDELLLKKSGAKFKQPSDYRNGSFSYMKRDGSIQVISLSQSSSEDTLSSSPNGTIRIGKSEPTISMRKLSEKLSNLTNRNSNARQPLVENDAFEGIGDEDL